MAEKPFGADWQQQKQQGYAAKQTQMQNFVNPSAAEDSKFFSSSSYRAALRFTNDSKNISPTWIPEETDPMREEQAIRILSTPEPQRDATEQVVFDLYAYLGQKKPKITWYESPNAAMDKWSSSPSMPRSMAFAHLTNYALSDRRQSWISPGPEEVKLNRVYNLSSRSLGRVSNMSDLILATLRYGTNFYVRPSYDDGSEWQAIDHMLNRLVGQTTGILLSAGHAYIVAPPSRILLNDAGVLDADDGRPAILWPDGQGVYALKGVAFPEETYTKIIQGHLSSVESIGLVDTDQRRVAISFLEPEAMIKALGAELVHEGKKRSYKYYGRRIERVDWQSPVAAKLKRKPIDITISNRLYRTSYFTRPGSISLSSMWSIHPTIPNYIPNYRYFLHYQDPSTGEAYVSFCTQGVNEVGPDADAAMAWKHHMTKEEYLTMFLEA